jgi:type II secretory pathway predicted ATPase ExeA
MSTFAYGLSKGEGFVVVTGEVGAGKTTLVQYMLDRLDTDQITVAKLNTSQLAAESLIRYVARDFGCRPEGGDKSDALASLRERLVDQFDRGRLPLLIVDEVQALPYDSLDDPDLEQLRQRVVASYHLNGLDPSEVHDYIAHRLREAGWDERRIFGADSIDPICRVTNGNPRQINRLCDRLLFNAYFNSAETVHAQDVADVVAEMADEGLITRPADRPAATPARAGAASAETTRDADPAATSGERESRPAVVDEVARLRALLDGHRARLHRIAQATRVKDGQR